MAIEVEPVSKPAGKDRVWVLVEHAESGDRMAFRLDECELSQEWESFAETEKRWRGADRLGAYAPAKVPATLTAKAATSTRFYRPSERSARLLREIFGATGTDATR